MTRFFFFLAMIANSIAFAVACGSSDNPPPSTPADASADVTIAPDASDDVAVADAAPDVDFGAASDAYPAFHPPVPQVVDGLGGVMSNVRIVPIFFAGDALQAQLTDFLQKYAAAPHWKTAVAEYGVGDLTIAPPLVIATSPGANVTDSQTRAMLRAGLDGTHAEWGKSDSATLATTIYAVFFPSGTTLVDDRFMPTANVCSPGVYAAYHSSFPRAPPAPPSDAGADAAIEAGADAATEAGGDSGVQASDPIIYAMLPRCSASGGVSQLDFLTYLIVHETTEAATDLNYAVDAYGFDWLDEAHQTWGITSFGGEVGDMCQLFAGAAFRPADVGYRIQRTWSNAAMKAYHDPCVAVPAASGPFFASVPIAPDTIIVRSRYSDPYRVKGVSVSVGKSKTIEVDLLSDGPTSGPWTIIAYDYAQRIEGQSQPNLGLVLDRNKGLNGEKVHLTITPRVRPANKTAFYFVESILGDQSMLWWGAVAIP